MRQRTVLPDRLRLASGLKNATALPLARAAGGSESTQLGTLGPPLPRTDGFKP